MVVCDKEGLTVVLVASSTFSQAEILQKLSQRTWLFFLFMSVCRVVAVSQRLGASHTRLVCVVVRNPCRSLSHLRLLVVYLLIAPLSTLLRFEGVPYPSALLFGLLVCGAFSLLVEV